MTEKEQDWEFGVSDDGHSVTSAADLTPVVLGEGDFRYEVSGKTWGTLPDG